MQDGNRGVRSSSPDLGLESAHKWIRNLHTLKEKIAEILEGDRMLPGLERPLTFSQIKLVQLVENGCSSDGCWSLNRLAEQMKISLPALSKNLSRLVPMGLVEVRADSRDGRKRRVSLTREGQAALVQFNEWRRKRLHELVKNSAPGELDGWNDSLASMVDRLDAYMTEAAVEEARD